jgi:hypothetical protein
MGNELVLVSWGIEGSVTRCDNVVTSAGGETAPGREKGGENDSWADVNLI